MLKLLRYLRPFTREIAVIFLLLFGQAMADLALPGYLANIANVGISQQGIENAVPQAIRQSEMDKLTMFMDAEVESKVSGDYTLLDRDSLAADAYAEEVKTYPALADEPVYVLQAGDEADIAALDTVFSRVIPVVSAIESDGATLLSAAGVQVPSGADPFEVLRELSTEQLARVKSAVAQQSAGMSETLAKQYDIAYISNEYRALGVDVVGVQRTYMLKIGLLMLLLTLAAAAASVSVGYLSSGVAARLGQNLRRDQFNRVINFSSTELDRFSTASLITRSTNDVTQIQVLIAMMFRSLFYAPILGIGGILKVMSSDSSMLWIIGAAVGAMVTFIVLMFRFMLPRFAAIQKLIDRLNLVARQFLTGQIVIRAFNTRAHEEAKFDEANAELTSTNLLVNRVMMLMMPVIMLVMNGTMILVVWVGSHQVDIGSMQVGDMMAFIQYSMQIIMSFLFVSFMFVMIPRASISANRISEVLETQPVLVEPRNPRSYSGELKGVVRFENVSFHYPSAENDVLSDISFTAEQGRTTAFIGSTGSGKSTLVNLIPRFYDVTAGRVLVDGIDVREVSTHDLREKIGYVPQKAVLFSGTVASNIRYGDEDATDDEVAKYAAIAQARDIVEGNNKGWDAEVAQGGNNLSGGQKQRLCIARALARKPELYIFDDSLSALDFKTEAALRKALSAETSGATVLIVAQRISSIMGADQIVVLDNGRVAGVGTHKELMRDCEVYRELALSQLSSRELNR